MIEVKYFGGVDSMHYLDFAIFEIQDEDEAERIALAMLNGNEPYEYDRDAGPEFFREFRILDADAVTEELRLQKESNQ